jgi:site-specific DNA recombinase
MVSVSQWEREAIGERTQVALQHKRTHRQAFNHEPYGYKRDGDVLVPLEAEQAIMARIRALRAAGGTLESIAGVLNAERVSTKRSGRWYARTVLNVLNTELYEAA